jgi:hypothetical protein
MLRRMTEGCAVELFAPIALLSKIFAKVPRLVGMEQHQTGLIDEGEPVNWQSAFTACPLAAPCRISSNKHPRH